jgi:hypothetical protein
MPSRQAHSLQSLVRDDIHETDLLGRPCRSRDPGPRRLLLLSDLLRSVCLWRLWLWLLWRRVWLRRRWVRRLWRLWVQRRLWLQWVWWLRVRRMRLRWVWVRRRLQPLL